MGGKTKGHRSTSYIGSLGDAVLLNTRQYRRAKARKKAKEVKKKGVTI